MKDTYRYTYNKMDAKTRWILGSVFFVISVVLFFISPAFGTIACIVGLGSIFPSGEGIEIDIINKKYRFINTYGPLSFGEWQSFSDVHYISVFKAMYLQSPLANIGIEESVESKTIQVNLICGKNMRRKLLETDDNDEAWEFAKEIAPKLNLRIWDATERKGKWYEEENSNTPTPA